MPSSFSLDTVLLQFKEGTELSTFTIRNAVESISIMGGIGSGKSSGSAKTIALKYLQYGFGGLVLTAKPDEKNIWIDYCKKTGREKDLIIVEPDADHAFNLLDYISSTSTGELSLTENIVQVLKTVIRASEEKSSGKNDDPFWENALDILLFNVIDLCQLAYGTVSIRAMYDIVSTAPKKDQPLDKICKPGTYGYACQKAGDKIKAAIDDLLLTLTDSDKAKLSDDWHRDQFFAEHIEGYSTFQSVEQFFSDYYINISEKTRGIIELCFSGFLFRLLKEPVYSLFCKKASTFTPEDCLDGKIILINLPVKKYQKVGRDAQIMFKYVWQLAMEQRDVSINDRPVFLWADEAQNFLHEHDAEYQATARSCRIATVYISQNLPNYYANMGGVKSEYRVKSFLGTLATKIFHANADHDTNTYASQLIGEAYVKDTSRNVQVAGQFSSGKTESFKLERMVTPEQFVELKTGGPLNNLLVGAYIHRQGEPFGNGFNHKHVTFSQA